MTDNDVVNPKRITTNMAGTDNSNRNAAEALKSNKTAIKQIN